MISRLTISESDNWDYDDVNRLIQDYEIMRNDIISITHENGMVYLYYFVTEKTNGN